MIEQLENFISKEQINEIVNIIIEQYSNFRKMLRNSAYTDLFDDDYSPHQKQHSLSWAIYSGFKNGNQITTDNPADTLNIECYKYSNNFTKPLLKNDKINIFIHSDTSNINANYLKSFYEKNVDLERENATAFCYFKFSVRNNELNEITLVFPDRNGNVIVEESLIQKNEIETRSAA